MDNFVLSVFELNTYVSDKLYQDPFLEDLWVSGEVVNLAIRHNTAYFSLSDGDATVECVLFEFDCCGYDDVIIDGQAVLIHGEISIYRKNGSFRISVQNAQIAGLGEMYAKFNKLKEKLRNMGIFDEERKRKIPPYAKKIGIVTSSEGAAITDIVSIIRRRSPVVKMLLYPVKVQGADAPLEISEGIQYFNNLIDVDVLIVGRGGGAAEDLFAFNDENVVMEIYNSKIPVISAVGHESDYTLADLAADLRAPTPSAAAELAVPVKDDVLERIFAMRMSIKNSIQRRLMSNKDALRYSKQSIRANSSVLSVHGFKYEVQNQRQRMKFCVNELYNEVFLGYNTCMAKLSGLNPEDIFKRGYSITMKNGFVVKRASDIKNGDSLDILFSDGVVKARAEEKEA